MYRFQPSICVVCGLVLLLPYASAQTARMPGSQSDPPQLETGSSHFSWLTGPYTRPKIAPIDLANSNRLESLLRAGKLYLSLQDAIALALENNLDIALQRYGTQLADANILRAKAGGFLRSVNTSVTAGPTSATQTGAQTGINQSASQQAANVQTTGNVLVRLVNAGLRMHVPSIVGALTGGASGIPGMQLIAEDGNVLPGIPRVQNEVFLAAGKTYDVLINAPQACTPVSPATTCTTPALPIFDRELSLSGNASLRDAGMLAYINVNGGALPSSPAISAAVARADTYNAVIAGQTFTLSDPGKGVIANDTNVYGVKLVGSGITAKGTLTLNADGTFTYVALPAFTGTDVFTYQANGTGPTTTITLGGATAEAASGITMGNATFNSNVQTFMAIKSPGVLAFDTDGAGYPLTVAPATLAAGPLAHRAGPPPADELSLRIVIAR